MQCLLLIDLQNDFLPGGALAVPQGDAVLPVANRLLPHFPLAAATQDWHPPGHGSFAANHPGRNVGERIELDGLEQILWPVHCVQGTIGAELAPGLDLARIQHVARKGEDPRLDSYSGLYDNGRRRATGLGAWLRSRSVTHLVVLGLATDYCVKHTVLDALDHPWQVDVVTDGCRAVDLSPGDGERAWEAMRKAGARLTTSEALLGG